MADLTVINGQAGQELEHPGDAAIPRVADLMMAITLVYEVIEDISDEEHAALGRLAREVDAAVDAVVDGPVLAATYWPNNGHMVADLHRLGYLRDSDRVLDPTYENGVWWQQWRPDDLTTLHRDSDGTDFRHLDFPAHSFDAITYDPPYVCPGGRKTSTMQSFHARYGMAEAGVDDPMFSTPAELQQLINDGLTEMVRLVKPAGLIFVKCQNYVWGGKFFEGAEHTRAHAIGLGCMVEDRLEFLAHPRPQPATNPDGNPRSQRHARRNLSTLFVFRAPNIDTNQQVLL